MFRFENKISESFESELLYQEELTFKLNRIFDIIRGADAHFSRESHFGSIHRKISDTLKLHTLSNPIARNTLHVDRDVLIQIAGQVTELCALESINYHELKLIVFVADAWLPRLEWLSKLVNKYNIDLLLTPSIAATNILSQEYNHNNVQWFPFGISKDIWNDYSIKKDQKFIQFGRKNSHLHQVILDNYGKDEYEYGFINKDINLEKEE
jgi:hypothetical protein